MSKAKAGISFLLLARLVDGNAQVVFFGHQLLHLSFQLLNVALCWRDFGAFRIELTLERFKPPSYFLFARN